MNTSNENFNRLIEISQIDEAIFFSEKEKKSFEKNIETKKEEIILLKKDLEEKLENKKKILIRKKEIENDLIDDENTLKKRQMELNSVKSNDAFKALLIEIENIKQKTSASETQMLEIMEKIDILSKEEKNLTENFKKEENEKKNSIISFENEIKKQETIINNFLEKRNVLLAQIDKNLLEKYESIKIKKGNALVKAEEKDKKLFCSACKISLTAKQISELKRNDTFIYCDNCGRMIYL